MRVRHATNIRRFEHFDQAFVFASIFEAHEVEKRWRDRCPDAPENAGIRVRPRVLESFWSRLDSKLRPEEKQIHIITDRNLSAYGRMLKDLGGANICYSGPCWTSLLQEARHCAGHVGGGSREH